MKRAATLSAALLLGCASEPVTLGLTEPVRVIDGQFQEGELPGLPPQTLDEILAEVPPVPPAFTSFALNSAPIEVGEERTASGLTTTDAVAVGVRFQSLGGGSWVSPVRAADPTNDHELTWGFPIIVNPSAPPGIHDLLFAAIDARGRAGTQRSARLCVRRPVPDNGNVCDPKISPPALVVSLEWDNDADLDLRVVTPSGKEVDGKKPTTAVRGEDGKLDTSAPGTGLLDRDSNARCARDSRRRENLVFQEKPEPGTYLIYVNLFDSCGEPSVRFRASLHGAAEGEEPGTYTVVESFATAGGLTAEQANAGKQRGLFVTEFNVQ